MRWILIAGTALLAIPAMAQVDPQTHKQCLEAKDYAGCVKAFTTPQQEIDDGLGGLRAAMKQVAARIRSGFSLRDSTLFFQPLTDQLALVSGKHPDSLAVQNAGKASELFNAADGGRQPRQRSAALALPAAGAGTARTWFAAACASQLRLDFLLWSVA